MEEINCQEMTNDLYPKEPKTSSITIRRLSMRLMENVMGLNRGDVIVNDINYTGVAHI